MSNRHTQSINGGLKRYHLLVAVGSGRDKSVFEGAGVRHCWARQGGSRTVCGCNSPHCNTARHCSLRCIIVRCTPDGIARRTVWSVRIRRTEHQATPAQALANVITPCVNSVARALEQRTCLDWQDWRATWQERQELKISPK